MNFVSDAIANEVCYRTAEIVVTMGEQTATAYVRQPGALRTKLGTPPITFHAADDDEVPYGDISVMWEAVEGATSYVVSLRDLDSDTLLIHHMSTSDETQTTLNSSYFLDEANYRLAVGAVPEGASSTEACVGWCERLFTVPEYVDNTEVYFTGVVYELTTQQEVSTANSLMEQEIEVTPDTMLAESNSYVIMVPNVESSVKVSVYYNEVKAEWSLFDSTVTDDSGVYKFKNSEEKSLSTVKHIDFSLRKKDTIFRKRLGNL